MVIQHVKRKNKKILADSFIVNYAQQTIHPLMIIINKPLFIISNPFLTLDPQIV